jgi:DNA-binding response OmpR family regulator
MARINALLRRAEGRLTAHEQVWAIDEASLRISWRGQSLARTALEFRMHNGRIKPSCLISRIATLVQ